MRDRAIRIGVATFFGPDRDEFFVTCARFHQGVQYIDHIAGPFSSAEAARAAAQEISEPLESAPPAGGRHENQQKQRLGGCRFAAKVS